MSLCNATHLGIGWPIRTKGKKRKRRKHGVCGREVGQKDGKEKVEFVCESCRGVKDMREAKMEGDWHWGKNQQR